MSTRLTPRVVGLLLVPPLMWAGNAVVGRLAAGHVPPLALNAMRWVLAALILLPLGWRVLATPGARREIALRWRPLAMLGLLGIGAYNALQYSALTTSSVLNVTLIVASAPFWMLAIGALFYGARPTAREALGAALSVAGVVVVLSRGELAQLAGVRFVRGDLLMLVAAIAWSFYSWLLARPHPSIAPAARPASWNWAGFLLVQVLFGIVWAGAAAGFEQAVSPAPVQWSPWVLAALAYVAIGPSVLAYRCWGAGVAAAGPAVASIFANLTPVFAAVLSAAVLGEPPQGYHVVAFALTVAGIVASMNR